MRSMSTLIFMSQRLFLTVLPECFPVAFSLVFMNKYIGVVTIIVMNVLFSQFIILISKKNLFFQKLY